MNITKLLFISFIFIGVVSCAPNPKTAKTLHNPIPKTDLSLGDLPDLSRLNTVGIVSIFVWPKEDDIPRIVKRAEKEIDRIKNHKDRSENDEKLLEGYETIASFVNVHDVQRFVGEHATKLDDAYKTINDLKSIRDLIDDLKLKQDQVANELLSEEKKKKLEKKARQEALSSFITCFLSKSEYESSTPKSCQSSVPEDANENEYFRYYPDSCQDLFVGKLPIIKMKMCQRKLDDQEKLDNIYGDLEEKELADSESYNDIVQSIALKKEEYNKLKESMYGPSDREIHLIKTAIEGVENQNGFDVDLSKTEFIVNFKEPLNSYFSFPIKNTPRISKTSSLFKEDYLVFEGGKAPQGEQSRLKTIRNINLIQKDGVPRLSFSMHGKDRVKDQLGREIDSLSPIHLDAELKFYYFGEYAIFSGKIKFFDEDGQVSKGMMKVVLTND